MKKLFGKLITDRDSNPFSNQISRNAQHSVKLPIPANELQRKGDEALKLIDEKRAQRREMKEQKRKAWAMAALD